ncbi:MAG: alanine racemase [Planctomycetota bacterium]
MDAFRAWTEIDLDALASNLQVIRRRAGPGVRVVLVVKQDAYGHGAVAIAQHAVRCGIGALGVGTSGEALELRRAGLRLPILVLGTVVDEELPACLRHAVHVGLHATDRRRSLQDLAARMDVVGRVHVNVDTGMGRLGVPPDRALDLLAQVRDSSHLSLEGVMTHIASPDGMLDPFTRTQLESFEQLLRHARERGLLGGWIHVANSASLFTGLVGNYDTVRPGIAAYGVLPTHLPGARELTAVMSLRARIVFLKDVPADTPVGYGSHWRATRATRIATVPLGYGHGLPLECEGWEVLIGGRRAPVVGRLSMDYLTLDVGHLAGVHVGQTVTLLGRDGTDELRLQDLAQRAATTPHGLTCALGRLAHVIRGGDRLAIAGQSPAGQSPAGRTAALRPQIVTDPPSTRTSPTP